MKYYLHIAIAERMNYIFITRDEDLFNISKNIITVNKPEELLN
ncbi:MAG: hypothetical protein AB7V77_01285 [Candidatus Woesearchaeota archaeon]